MFNKKSSKFNYDNYVKNNPLLKEATDTLDSADELTKKVVDAANEKLGWDLSKASIKGMDPSEFELSTNGGDGKKFTAYETQPGTYEIQPITNSGTAAFTVNVGEMSETTNEIEDDGMEDYSEEQSGFDRLHGIYGKQLTQFGLEMLNSEGLESEDVAQYFRDFADFFEDQYGKEYGPF